MELLDYENGYIYYLLNYAGPELVFNEFWYTNISGFYDGYRIYEEYIDRNNLYNLFNSESASIIKRNLQLYYISSYDLSNAFNYHNTEDRYESARNLISSISNEKNDLNPKFKKLIFLLKCGSIPGYVNGGLSEDSIRSLIKRCINIYEGKEVGLDIHEYEYYDYILENYDIFEEDSQIIEGISNNNVKFYNLLKYYV